jgi:hypothetical protein
MKQGWQQKIVESKPEGRREVRRPWLRWLEDIENDLQELKVIRWRQKASNGEEKVSVIEGVKVSR